MNRKQLILHVGSHKTGSTYIQDLLVRSRKYLDRHDISYPKAGITIYGHHGLANAIRQNLEKSPAAEILHDIHAEIAGKSRVILSSEAFSVMTPEALEVVANSFQDFDIRVVYFLRRLPGFLPSLWQELVKAGKHLSFEEFMMAACGDTPPFREFSPLLQLDKLSRIFGLKNLDIYSYDNLFESNENIYNFFLRNTVEIAPESGLDNTSVNASLTDEIIELVRSLNMVSLRQTGAPSGTQVRQDALTFLRDHPADPDVAKFNEAYHRYKKVLPLKTSHPLVRQTEANIWKTYGGRILNPHSSDTLYASPPGETKVFHCSRYWFDCAMLHKSLRNILSKSSAN